MSKKNHNRLEALDRAAYVLAVPAAVCALYRIADDESNIYVALAFAAVGVYLGARWLIIFIHAFFDK